MSIRFARMSFLRMPFCLLVAGVLPLAGCLPEDAGDIPDPTSGIDDAAAGEFITPPAPSASDGAASTEELLAEWKALSADPSKHELSMRDVVISKELGKRGPENLGPLIDVIDAEDSTPEQKVFAVRSLAAEVRGEHLDRLKGIVSDSEDTTSRACATTLIANVQGADVSATLKELAEDPEGRVSMAAIVGLADKGDAAMRQRLVDMYWDDATNLREKARIVVAILQEPTPEDFKLLADAAVRAETDPFTRQNIVYLFGRTGDESVLPALDEIANRFAFDEALKNMADAATETIKRRMASE